MRRSDLLFPANYNRKAIYIYKVVALTVNVCPLITLKTQVRLRIFKQFWNRRFEERVPFVLNFFWNYFLIFYFFL
jgi:hypothetical protein